MSANPGGIPGAAPPAGGTESNPHNPSFISERPWYLGEGGGAAAMDHQTANNSKQTLSLAEEDALRARQRKGAAVRRAPARKFVKGACKNCGATTHAAKDCLERPRKVQAWKQGRQLAADDVAAADVSGALSFDAKRDRWAGYDPTEHRRVVKRYEREEAERKRIREEQAAQQDDAPPDSKRARAQPEDDSDDSSDDEDPDAAAAAAAAAVRTADADDGEYRIDDASMRATTGMAGRGTQGKTTMRSLRLREDVAKYLLNLDPDSAYYDPKTRSMREAPDPHANPAEADYAGENYVRDTGDAKDLARVQAFAWAANERGQNAANEVANPSATELMVKEAASAAERQQQERAKLIADKYGGQEHLNSLPRELVYGQTEAFNEYAPDGSLLRGAEPAVARSKYEEDVHPNNHTSVWGSYFCKQSMAWGYKCCESTVKNSYCTGAPSAASSSTEQMMERVAAAPAPAALKPRALTERFSKGSASSSGVTDEEMEAYRRDRARAEDPLASKS